MTVLQAPVVAAIEDLEFAARLVVEGLRAGSHRSPFHGFSAEFQQHRPYRHGDDLKYLDWKLLARTDRLYSRQFRETTSMSVMLVLDASASMAFPPAGVSKFRYATILAAALAYLISTQGDAVGLMTTQNGALTFVPARGGRVHLRALLARLARLDTSGAWDGARAISRAADLLKRRGALVVLSDFYDEEEQVQRELRRVRRRGHDVSMLHVLSPEETQFAYGGDLEFEDLETGTRRLVNAAHVAGEYRRNFDRFAHTIERNAIREGRDYARALTNSAPEHVLREFLIRRAATTPVSHSDGSRAS